MTERKTAARKSPPPPSADIAPDAIIRPTMRLRFKDGRLQQRFLIEETKSTYYRWLLVESVGRDAED